MKERMISQDIAKGIGILIVVLTHTVQGNRIVGSIIAILFGYIMPFYMFMSGYNYHKNDLSPWENIKKRNGKIFKSMIISSLIIGVVMGAYFLIRKEATLYELVRSYGVFLISKWGARLIGINLPQVYFQRLLGPYWFLQFLMVSNVFFYFFVDKATKSTKSLLSYIILLSGISVVLIEYGVVLPWGIQNAPAIASVMILGTWFKKCNLLSFENSNPKVVLVNCLICLLSIGLIQLNYNGAGYVGAGALGEVCGGAEVYLFIVIAIIGSYFIINFSEKIKNVPILSNVLIWFGRHTLLVLLSHITIVHILKDIFGLPQFNAADQLFVEKMDLRTLPIYFLTLIIVYLLIVLIEKFVTKKK